MCLIFIKPLNVLYLFKIKIFYFIKNKTHGPGDETVKKKKKNPSRLFPPGGVQFYKHWISFWPIVMLRRLFKQHLKKALHPMLHSQSGSEQHLVWRVEKPVACHDCVLPDTSPVIWWVAPFRLQLVMKCRKLEKAFFRIQRESVTAR